jgi:hypothetical protein
MSGNAICQLGAAKFVSGLEGADAEIDVRIGKGISQRIARIGSMHREASDGDAPQVWMR